MKKYIYGMTFILSLSLCAAQDEGEKKQSVAEESAQASKQAKLDKQLWDFVVRTDVHLHLIEVEELLKQGANPNLKYEDNRTNYLLELVSVSPICFELAELLLRYGANPNGVDQKKSTVISEIEDISLRPRHQYDIRLEKLKKYATKPLSWPHFDRSRKDILQFIELLLNYGANINLQESRNGDTALIIAAKNNDPEAVAFLLDHGADDTIVNKSGETFHDFAVKYEAVLRAHQAWTKRVQQKVDEVVPQLPQTVSDCITSKLGITGNDLALVAAIQHGAADDVEAELKRGADASIVLDPRAGAFVTCPPLYFALVNNDCLNKVNALVCYGADVNQLLFTPLLCNELETRRVYGNCLSAMSHYLHASLWKDQNIVSCLKLLVKSGLRVNECNFYGNTPLYELTQHASASGYQELANYCNFLEFLLDHGADTATLGWKPTNPEIAQIIEQSKSKRLSAIDQSLLQMPATVVGVIGQYSDCAPLEQPKKEKPDAGDEKE